VMVVRNGNGFSKAGDIFQHVVSIGRFFLTISNSSSYDTQLTKTHAGDIFRY
jgi:hypothetical protein